MEAWIEFGRGPLFRLAFSLMVLGLLRVFILTIVGIVEAYRRSSDRIVPWKQVARQTAGWLLPIGRLWSKRAVYSSTSFLFHAGLLMVPLFLAAHVLLWRRSVGFAWPAMPQPLANWLTLLTDRRRAGPVFRPRAPSRRPGLEPASGLFLAVAAGDSLRDGICVREPRNRAASLSNVDAAARLLGQLDHGDDSFH